MPPRKKSSASAKGEAASPMRVNSRGEVLQFKSPAEFFAENQNIAGFDNPGKSLYTTIRELVENSLDAAESIRVLPEIELTIEELTEESFNKLRGVSKRNRVDHALYVSNKKQKRKSMSTASTPVDSPAPTPPDTPRDAENNQKLINNIDDEAEDEGKSNGLLKKESKKNSRANRGDTGYFRVTCKDNGVGMPHERIPEMLGRVLAGSKYGVRQTRGKFGLGAKMALIWSKKSTGLPLEVWSAHSPLPPGAEDTETVAAPPPPPSVTYCKLDIDIYKNRPNVHVHDQRPNDKKWRGTKMSVTIGGNWKTYKSRIMQYMQQLAIITPYAQFQLKYINEEAEQRGFTIRFDRRSDQMPPPAKEVKHHPSSVNNLLMKQLLERSRTKSLVRFLSAELSSIDGKLAKRLIAELGGSFSESMKAGSLTSSQVHQLVHLLGEVSFKPPDGKALSPAGEYNLRLGILKELDPEFIATHSEPPAVFEGHSFIVEAGVALGGKGMKEGLNVYRFANRIPLLFEAGGDVATRTAMRKINWSSYKIDHRRDRVGVFVSIVSTKIPFKGTGKEYIGDDIVEMQKAVKHVLQMCCQQLRNKLLKRNAIRDLQARRNNMKKYIPNVSRAIFGVLETMQKEQNEPEKDKLEQKEGQRGHEDKAATDIATDPEYEAMKSKTLAGLSEGTITVADIQKHLETVVAKDDKKIALEAVTTAGKKDKTKTQEMYIVPLDKEYRAMAADIYHPACIMRFFSTAVAENAA